MNNNKYLECNNLEEFNAANDLVVGFEDERLNGEYTKTNTKFIYPAPVESEEGAGDAYPYYFLVRPTWFSLFDEQSLLSEIPVVDEEEVLE